jgi:hypothetical protein
MYIVEQFESKMSMSFAKFLIISQVMEHSWMNIADQTDVAFDPSQQRLNPPLLPPQNI